MVLFIEVVIATAIFLTIVAAFVIWELLQDRLEMSRCVECGKVGANKETFLCNSCSEIKTKVETNVREQDSEAATIIR